MGQISTDQSHQVVAALTSNVDWSLIDFEKSGLQDLIVRNPKEAGRQFGLFLQNGGRINAEFGLTIDWSRTYKTLGLKFKPGDLVIEASPNFWDVYVQKGVTPNMVVAAFRKLGVNVYTYTSDLDSGVPTNDRDPKNGSYRVRFQKTIEADPELANKSAEDLAEEKIKGVTLLERLLLELGYFLATGEHLDIANVTLCSGSRYSDGRVPGVFWLAGDRRLCVRWYGQQSRRDGLRARAAVS